MAGKNPQDNADKLAAILKAWKELRPTKTFAKMTLEQFTTKAQPSLDAREHIDELEEEMTAALVARDTADVETLKQIELVVSAVKGDPDEGEDGALYAAMGYVRKSDRKTGKTNKPKPQPAAATH